MSSNTAKPKLTVANRITILRFLGVPFFILMLVYYVMGLVHGEQKEMFRALALASFTLLALTDALDGYFARSRGQITALGKILDPLADKALLLSALILLTRPSIPALEPHVPIWFTVLVISRDTVLVLGSIIVHALAGSVEVKPRIVGKLATFFQMVTIIWVLSGAPVSPFLSLVVLAALCTATSGVIYIFDGLRQLEKTAAAHRHSHDHQPA